MTFLTISALHCWLEERGLEELLSGREIALKIPEEGCSSPCEASGSEEGCHESAGREHRIEHEQDVGQGGRQDRLP